MSLATAFISKVYPQMPTGPTVSPAGYITPATILNNPTPPIDASALEALRGNLIEVILQQVVLAIVGVVFPGSSFEQLQEWADNLITLFPGLGDLIEILTGVEDGDLDDLGTWVNNLITFLGGIDLSEFPFPLAANARQFAQEILDRTRRFFTSNQVAAALTNGGFPYGFATDEFTDGIVFPDGHPIKRYIRNLHTALDLPDISEVGASLIDLVQVFMDRLNIQGFIDNVINAIDFFGEILSETNPVGNILDRVLNLVQSIMNAHKATVSLEDRITVLEGATITVLDDFNRSSASSLGSSWTVHASSGAGGGTLGLDGSGNAQWKASGTGTRTEILRYNVQALPLDRGILSVVLAERQSVDFFGTPYLYLCCRIHASNNTYMRVRFHYNGATKALLQAVVAGVVTNIGVETTISSGSITIGDRLDFYFGSASDPYNFIINLNGQEKLNVTDGSHLVTVGATQRYVGFGMTGDGGGFATQSTPARLTILSASSIS